MTDAEFAKLREMHMAAKAEKDAEQRRIRAEKRKAPVDSEHAYFLEKMRNRIEIQAGEKL